MPPQKVAGHVRVREPARESGEILEGRRPEFDETAFDDGAEHMRLDVSNHLAISDCQSIDKLDTLSGPTWGTLAPEQGAGLVLHASASKPDRGGPGSGLLRGAAVIDHRGAASMPRCAPDETLCPA